MAAWIEPLEPGPRCRKWKLCVAKGSGTSRVRRTRVFHGGKREAQTALSAFAASVDFRAPRRACFADFAESWNDARFASGAISEGTHEKYFWHIKAAAPLLDMPMSEVRPSDVAAAYAALGRKWTGTTLRALHCSLARIFRAAVAEGVVTANPMDEVDAPRADTREKRALSPAESARLLSALDVADNRQFAVSLILSCGLRRGEAVSLRWCDYRDGVLVIPRNVTKSDAGARTLPLDAATTRLVDDRRALVESFLEGVGAALAPHYALCCGLDGRPLTATALRHWWERNRAGHGLEGWTLHELRHTFLTNLAQAGVHPSVMQKIAGHASMSTVMEIYTHVHDDDLRKAFDAVSQLRN